MLRKKPDWLKVKAPGGERFSQIKQQLRDLKLHTVCEEARCPNLGECWNGGTATIMLLGDVCTRGCRFCAITSGKPGGVVDAEEPYKVGGLVALSGLDYVVLTSVNRDDLSDGGAGHFAETVRQIKLRAPHILCETLVPDFQGSIDAIQALLIGGVDVYAHNVETVRRLTPRVRDRRAGYDQTLNVLQAAKKIGKDLRATGKIKNQVFTKTSIQLGHGETDEEVLETLRDLRLHDVDIVTFGQYLQPTKKHLPVEEFVTPEKFQYWERVSNELGFVFAASGPLVRSSYKAGEYFISNMIRKSRGEELSHGIQVT